MASSPSTVPTDPPTAETARPPDVVCRGLTKRYGDTTVVDRLDLTVAAGTIACILGPNGSGKSTTVGMLTTLRRPSGGSASVGGHDVVRAPAAVRAVTGTALQRTGLDLAMSGRDTLMLQARLHGLPPSAARRRVAELIELTGLAGHADAHLRILSGGLRRRLDLAIALVHRPRIVFLDEPTTGLDPASRRSIWAEIRRLSRDDGVTVVLTTQVLDEADHLADTVSILRDGRLLVTATPRQLKDELGQRALTLELADADQAARAAAALAPRWQADHIDDRTLRLATERDDPARCVAVLARADLEVTSMRAEEPSLEDVFLRLTAA